MKKSRYPAYKRGDDGKPVCRGCGAPVPKGRQTWCSKECYRERCPAMVIAAVRQRDGDKCQTCGYDFKAEQTKHFNARPSNFAPFSDYEAWCKAKPRKREYDHILPFSQGGETTLDNMRLLCHDCHVKRTSEWRRERAKAKRTTLQPELAIA